MRIKGSGSFKAATKAGTSPLVALLTMFSNASVAARCTLGSLSRVTTFKAATVSGENGATLPSARAAVSKIESFKQQEAARIKALTYRDLNDAEAESLILRCYELEILSPRTVHTAIKEWRTPSFDEFAERNAWSLFNAITFAIGKRAKTNPQTHAALTIKLGALLSPDATEPQYTLPV